MTKPVPDEMSAPLRSLSEDRLLQLVFPVYAKDAVGGEWVPVGNGDDTALVRTSDGATLATTDTMVRGSDWLDAWSTPFQVGVKCAAQNLADIAAMGGVTRGLLVTLAADPATPVRWAVESARGVAHAAREAGASVLGGDLSSAPAGTVMLSITALGDLQGRAPVLRSGARPGDSIAVAGTLGCSGAGLELLRAGRPRDDDELVAMHLTPTPPVEQGPVAAHAGATSMIDLSDGLLIDAGRVARASAVVMALRGAALEPDVQRLASVLDHRTARECVLAGGEEHSLLATFPAETAVPAGWRVLGRVEAASASTGDAERGWVTVDGNRPRVTAWDHFDR